MAFIWTVLESIHIVAHDVASERNSNLAHRTFTHNSLIREAILEDVL